MTKSIACFLWFGPGLEVLLSKLHGMSLHCISQQEHLGFCGKEELFPQIHCKTYLYTSGRHTRSNLLARNMYFKKISEEIGLKFNFWQRMSNRISPCFKPMPLRRALVVYYQMWNYQLNMKNRIRKIFWRNSSFRVASWEQTHLGGLQYTVLAVCSVPPSAHSCLPCALSDLVWPGAWE